MAENILWAHKASRKRRIRVDGEVREERRPQIGHAGNSDYDRPALAKGTRWDYIVDADGGTYHVPVTNGAAHMSDQTPYAGYVRAKGRHLGRFPLGKCPVAMLLNGELNGAKIIDKSLLKSQPCAHGTYSENEPCPHTKAEMAARKAQHVKRQEKLSKAAVPEVERILAGQKDQTVEIANVLKDAVQDIAASMQSAGKKKGGE